jgi:predicted MFS family arabinose efflux permease
MSFINSVSSNDTKTRERLLRILAGLTFLICFQAYMVAPMIPQLSSLFGISAQKMGLLVPAYLIPYGVSTLFFGLLSDWIGRKRIMLASLMAFAGLTGLTATAVTPDQMIFWRLLTGLGASGVVPLALALMGQLFPYEQRGRALGWLFGAVAGGMAFGSTFGVLLEPAIGWRGVFLAVSALGFVGLVLLRPYLSRLGDRPPTREITLASVATGYKHLLTFPRAQRTYLYVLLNAIFHSGVFTWLGLYFSSRYGLGEVGIGLALIGYGVPGFIFGPLIGSAADRWGRHLLVPAGIGLAALAAFLLVPASPLVEAAVTVTLLSLGYDMTQPLLAGIVTALDPKRSGQAMGLNVFALFTGFGLGSLLFGWALQLGFTKALLIFAAAQAVAGLAAVKMFRFEQHEPVQAQFAKGD